MAGSKSGANRHNEVAGLNGMNGRDGRDSRPVPDPTIQTALLVKEAVTALEAVLNERIAGHQSAFQARLNGNEEAVKLLQTILDRQPSEVDVKIQHLERLHSSRFEGMETRFLERDDKVKEAKADAKVGIDAALASAEKLVGQSNDSFKELFEKAERSTEKLLDKQDENQKNSALALEDKIGGLKERLDRIEGAAVGAITAKGEGVVSQTMDRGSNQFNLNIVMAAVTVIAVIFSIVTALR